MRPAIAPTETRRRRRSHGDDPACRHGLEGPRRRSDRWAIATAPRWRSRLRRVRRERSARSASRVPRAMIAAASSSASTHTSCRHTTSAPDEPMVSTIACWRCSHEPKRHQRFHVSTRTAPSWPTTLGAVVSVSRRSTDAGRPRGWRSRVAMRLAGAVPRRRSVRRTARRSAGHCRSSGAGGTSPAGRSR